MKPSCFSIARSDLPHLVAQIQEPRFRAKQLENWLYDRREWQLEHMTNLPKTFCSKLADSYHWGFPEIINRLDGDDGSTKLLLKSNKGHLIETVVLRYENRTSLCVSSQVGCRLSCAFCQTGKLGFVRNLSRDEIVMQFVLANQLIRSENRKISHVVFMGMGEPLDNYDAVISAVNCFIDDFQMSARHVTISTSGLVPKIIQLAQDTRAALAVSLHASRDVLRSELMPINRRYGLADLKDALLHYQKTTGKKITIEYILIRNKNCSEREAKELVRFLHGLRAKVNLIPFNAHPGLPYERPSEEEVRSFQKYLATRSYPAPVRYSKGLEVSAACGQLAAKVIDSLQESPKRDRVLS